MIKRTVFASLIFVAALSGCTLDSFMFDPVHLDNYNLPDSVIADTLREGVAIERDGITLYGFYCRQTDSLAIEPHPIIVYHHGNDENIQHFWPRIELLYKAGFDVFIYDYRGYGMSTGTLTSEEELLADARAAYDYVLSRDDIDPEQVVHYGFSLGSVPALYLAGTTLRARAVVIESAYASGEALVQSGTLLNIPGGYLLDGTFDNVSRISKISTSLLMLHGTEDRFIPIERHGDPLYEAAVNPKTFIRVQGAGHSTVPETMGHEDYIDIITAFIRGS